MKKDLNQLKTLTIASLKMYYRNKTAVFFSLFMPLLIIVIFGFIFKNSNASFNLAVSDQANNQASQSIIKTLEKTKTFTIKKENYSAAVNDLKQGNEDLVLDIPSGITFSPSNTAKITGYYDQEKAENAQTAFLVINNILQQYNDGIYTQISGHTVPQFVSIAQKGIQTNNLSEIDFIIPGMIAFSIMQAGLFSVAFAFTSMKKTGALKRLKATPARPENFILSQAFSRLILSVIQVLILLLVGIKFFGLHMYGNFFSMLVFVLIGSIVFLAIGFAIAGYAKDENQAAPIANLVSLPMTFLSGVFFPRSLMPDFLKNVTQYFPLTYLSDAIRQIANNGAAITHLQGDLIGLLIWAVICMIIAVKLFKWE